MQIINYIAMQQNTFTSSPLRNRIRVELNSPTTSVWGLLGDLAKFPEYSFGLDKVDASVDAAGNCTEYVCHFKPVEEGGESITHKETIRWYEPNKGWASVAEEPNAFGLTDAVTIINVEQSGEGTIMTWDQYYNAADLEMTKGIFDQALADIGQNLVNTFGGKVLEQHTEK
jgi:hypothetical protein